MALYELRDAKLDGVEGEGYAYVVDTHQGKAYRGVFFARDETALNGVSEHDEPVAFEGTVYHKTVERVEKLDVAVTGTVPVAAGTRADFEVVEA